MSDSDNEITIKRTIKLVGEDGNPTGDEVKVDASFTHVFPESAGGEEFEAYFENETAKDRFMLLALKNKMKQVAGTWVIGNYEDTKGLQDYMDEYVIPERSAAGRKKIYKVTSDQLKDAKVSAKNIAALAELLGINVELDGE